MMRSKMSGILVFVAHLLEVVFEKTRIPDILLLIILGVFVGPVMELLDPQSDFGIVGDFLAILTLLVMLFETGLTLRLKNLVSAAGRATPFALTSMFGAIAGISGMLYLAGTLTDGLAFDGWTSIMGGFILGGTSAAVVIPMVKALKSSDKTTTILMLESTITDVFCIIGSIGIATGLAAGTGVQASGLVTTAAFSLIMAVFFGVACGIGWALLLAVAKRMSNAMFTNLAFAMVVYGLAEHMGISGAIAVLCFGITMGHMPDGMELKFTVRGKADPMVFALREVSTTERKVYAETVFLLKAFFFFYLGLKVNLSAFISGLGVLALLLAAIPFLPRFPMVQLFLDRKQTTRREAMLATVLVPRGLAAAVLAEVPRTLGLPGADDLASVVAMMVFISIFMVSVLVILIERGVLDIFGKAAFFRFPISLPTEAMPETAGDNVPAVTEAEAAPEQDNQTAVDPQESESSRLPSPADVSTLTMAELAEEGDLDAAPATHTPPEDNEDSQD